MTYDPPLPNMLEKQLGLCARNWDALPSINLLNSKCFCLPLGSKFLLSKFPDPIVQLRTRHKIHTNNWGCTTLDICNNFCRLPIPIQSTYSSDAVLNADIKLWCSCCHGDGTKQQPSHFQTEAHPGSMFVFLQFLYWPLGAGCKTKQSPIDSHAKRANRCFIF